MKHRILPVLAVLTLLATLPLAAQVMTRRIDASSSVLMPEIASIATAAEEGDGVTLTVLPAGSRPEENRGLDLEMGDQVLMMNGERIRSIDTLRELYDGVAEGGEVKLAIQRGDQRFMVAFAKGDGSTEGMMGGGGGGGMRVMIAGPGAENVTLVHEARALLNDEDGEVRVSQVLRDMGNLAEGDVIEKVNGEAVASMDDYRRIYEGAEVGDELLFTVRRGGAEVDVKIVKEEMPAGMMMRGGH